MPNDFSTKQWIIYSHEELFGSQERLAAEGLLLKECINAAVCHPTPELVYVVSELDALAKDIQITRTCLIQFSDNLTAVERALLQKNEEAMPQVQDHLL